MEANGSLSTLPVWVVQVEDSVRYGGHGFSCGQYGGGGLVEGESGVLVDFEDN